MFTVSHFVHSYLIRVEVHCPFAPSVVGTCLPQATHALFTGMLMKTVLVVFGDS